MNNLFWYSTYFCMIAIMSQLSAGEGFRKPQEIISMRQAQEEWQKNADELKNTQQAREKAQQEVKEKQQELNRKREVLKQQAKNPQAPVGEIINPTDLKALQSEITNAQVEWKAADQNFKEQIQVRENLINNPYVALYRDNLKALTVAPETSEVPSMSPSRGPATGLNRIWRNMQKWWYERALQGEGSIGTEEVAQIRAKLDTIYRDLGQPQNLINNRNAILQSSMLSEEQQVAHHLRSLQLLENIMRTRKLTESEKETLYNTFADTAVDLLKLRDTLPQSETNKFLVEKLDGIIDTLAQAVTRNNKVAHSDLMKKIVLTEKPIDLLQPVNREKIKKELIDKIVDLQKKNDASWSENPETAFSNIEFQTYIRTIRQLQNVLKGAHISPLERAALRLMVREAFSKYGSNLEAKKLDIPADMKAQLVVTDDQFVNSLSDFVSANNIELKNNLRDPNEVKRVTGILLDRIKRTSNNPLFEKIIGK